MTQLSSMSSSLPPACRPWINPAKALLLGNTAFSFVDAAINAAQKKGNCAEAGNNCFGNKCCKSTGQLCWNTGHVGDDDDDDDDNDCNENADYDGDAYDDYAEYHDDDDDYGDYDDDDS